MLMVFIFLVQKNYSQSGNSCSDPIIINTLPYINSVSSQGKGNKMGMICPTVQAMDGEDLVFKFKFNKDTLLLFKFSITDAYVSNYACFEILKNCPFDKAYCIKSGYLSDSPFSFIYCYKANEEIYIHFDLYYVSGFFQNTTYNIHIPFKTDAFCESLYHKRFA